MYIWIEWFDWLMGCLGVLELLSANGGRFEIHHLFFADDTDSKEKLCRLVTEFGRACEIS